MPEAGSVIGGKYRLTRPIGQGAMASVWSAVHETLGRPVAIKFIHANAKGSEVVAARFMREAKIAAAVQHRFVVDIFDFGETDGGEPYMVMEQLDGETLADRITRGPAIPVKTFVRMMEECLTGLDAVHGAGIIHRDLKPENIFVIHDGDGTFPKLLDFGISRADDSLGTDRRTKLTREGAVLGTPWYMSPEQIRGRADLDRRTDLYAIGVILYEVLSGALPFDSDTLGDLMVRIATDEAPPLLALRPDLPAELSDLIAKSMAKNADDRFQDATSFRLALRRVRQQLPDDAFTIVMKATPSDPPEKLGSADILVRPRSPSVPPKRSVGAEAPTVAQGELDDGGTVETMPRPPASGRARWVVAAVALLAVAGVGTAIALGGEEPVRSEPLVPLEPAGADEAAEVPPSEPSEPTPPDEDADDGVGPTADPEVGTAPDEPPEPEVTMEVEAPSPMRRRRARRRAPSMGTPEHFDDPGF